MNHLQRIPKGMRPQTNASFCCATIHTDMREGQRRGALGTGHAHTLKADALRFVICVFDEPKLVADPLSTKLTHFMANGIHKQQQKRKQSAHTTAIEREREHRREPREQRAWESVRELYRLGPTTLSPLPLLLASASLRKIISICCCCLCYSSSRVLPLSLSVSLYVCFCCVCVCVFAACNLRNFAVCLATCLVVAQAEAEQRPGRGSAARSTTRATSAAEPVELFAQHTLSSKIRNQKPVPSLKLATRLRQIKKKLAQPEASKLDVNCELTTLTQTLSRCCRCPLLPLLCLCCC